jgi:hypothetical protein
MAQMANKISLEGTQRKISSAILVAIFDLFQVRKKLAKNPIRNLVFSWAQTYEQQLINQMTQNDNHGIIMRSAFGMVQL